MSVIAPDLVSVSYEPWYVKLLTYVAGSHNTLPTTNGQLYISPAWLSGYTSHQLIPPGDGSHGKPPHITKFEGR